MRQGYRLNLSISELSDCLRKNTHKVHNVMDSSLPLLRFDKDLVNLCYDGANDYLSAEKINEVLFPDVDCDVFVSYSHMDIVTLDDYYNGENCANFLLLLLLYDNTNPKSTLWNLTRLDICESIISSFKNETRLSKWELATYAVCLYHLGDFKNAKIWEQKFKDAADAKWEKNTFDETVNMIKKYNSTMFGI